jgi:hypothetical protein
MRGNTDPEFTKQVFSYVTQPKDGFGRTLRTVPPELQPTVNAMNDFMVFVNKVEATNPLTKTRKIRTTYTKAESYEALRKKIQHEADNLIKDFPSHATLKQMAKRQAIEELGTPVYDAKWHSYLDNKLNKGWRRGADRDAIIAKRRDDIVADMIDGKLEEGMKLVMAGRIADSIPYRDMGYWPRKFTEEFKDAMAGVLKQTRYQDMSAYSYMTTHALPRKFYEFNAQTWNDMWTNGTMPHDFMAVVQEQVRAAGKGSSLGKAWDRMLGFLDNPQIDMFNTDIMEMAYVRAKSSLRAVGNADYQAQLMKNVSRVLGETEEAGRLGEKTYLYSPQGMEAVYGPAWKETLGKPAVEMYESVLTRNRLAPNADGIHSPFIETLGHSDLQALKSAGFPIHAMNGEVAEEMGKWMKMYSDPSVGAKFLQEYDEFQNFWKATTLAIWPGFFMRNFGGNFWMAYGAGSFSLRGYKDAIGLITNSDVWRKGFPKKSVSSGSAKSMRDNLRKATGRKTLDAYDIEVGGITYTGEQQVHDLTKFGGLGTFAQKEVLGGARMAGAPKGGLEKVLRTPGVRHLTQYGPAIETGWWVNSQMENIHRIALYRDRLQKGFTPFDAAMEVKKYFFDYDMLTSFEKGWMKRWFPFYSWTRFNMPLQVNMAITMPGKFGNFKRAIETFVQSEEAREFDQSMLPEFVSESLGIPTRINKKTGNVEVLYGRYWWPGSDLMSIVHHNLPKAALRTAGTLLGPAQKFGIEQLTGQNLYSGRPIEQYPGQETKFLGVPMEASTVHKMKTFRGFNELNKLFAGGPGGRELSTKQRVAGFMGLPKVASFNPEILEQRKKFDIAMLKGKLKKDYTKAMKVGDEDLAERILARARAAEKRKARRESR